MASVSFTHGIDAELRTEIEKTARFEDCGASRVANLAIRGFVDERQATRDLVREGLRQVAAGAPAILSEDVRDWLLAAADRLSPEDPLIRADEARTSPHVATGASVGCGKYRRRHSTARHPAAGRRFDGFLRDARAPQDGSG